MTRHFSTSLSLILFSAICARPTSRTQMEIQRKALRVKFRIIEQLVSAIFGRRNNEIQMPRFKSPDFEKEKGISHFPCCSRPDHSRGVRHRFGLSSFGPGTLATTQRCGSRVPERERCRHDENDE